MVFGMFGGKSKTQKQGNGRSFVQKRINGARSVARSVGSSASSYAKNARNAVGARTTGAWSQQFGSQKFKEGRKIYKTAINAMQRSLTMEMRNVERGNSRSINMNNMKTNFNKLFNNAKTKLDALEKENEQRRQTMRAQKRGNSPTLNRTNNINSRTASGTNQNSEIAALQAKLAYIQGSRK